MLFLLVQVKGVPKPDPSGDLGLTGKPKDEEGDKEQEQRRGGKGGKSENQLDELEFKDEYQNQGEQAPVAVVLLHDDYSPPPGAFYFRQTAFSQWNGRRLVAATRDDVDRDVALRFPLEPIEVESAPPVGDGRRALRTTIGLMTDHVRPFALDSPARLEPAHNPDALRFQRVYAVRSHVPILPYDSLLGLAAGSQEWPPEVFDYYTEAPGDPRYAELAAKATEVLDPKWQDDPLAQALAIKLYLDKNGKYSRKSNHAGAADPTADFLFGDLTGYCVHFAHAAVYLFRTRGIPARVAAGYAVPESDRGSGSALLIQGKSAHAWPEIYLDGMGWVVVDIAPETSLDPPDPDADQKLQQMLGEMLRQSPEDEQLRDRLRSRWNPRFWFFWLLIAAVLVGYGTKLYRAFAPQFAGSPRLYRVAYRAALDHLAEAGFAREPGENREDFARRAELLSPSFGGLTRQHLGQALGSRTLEAPAEVHHLLGAVRLELHRNASWQRRLLSHLRPLHLVAGPMRPGLPAASGQERMLPWPCPAAKVPPEDLWKTEPASMTTRPWSSRARSMSCAPRACRSRAPRTWPCRPKAWVPTRSTSSAPRSRRTKPSWRWGISRWWRSSWSSPRRRPSRNTPSPTWSSRPRQCRRR